MSNLNTNDRTLLEMKSIAKFFPGVKALNGVDFTLNRGEVVALVGENGAGKSTLMKILCGLYQADEGTILIDGEPVRFLNPSDAKQAGVVMIHQEISLVLDMSVAENIYLGSLPTKKNLVDWKALNTMVELQLKLLGYDIDPKTPVRMLSIAQQQMVEICRGITLGARILVLDEPTSSITEKETEILFANIERLKKQGIGIVYISHKIDEIKQITDRIIVLRDGQNSGSFVTENTEITEVISTMIGRKLDNYYFKSKRTSDEKMLEVENLSVDGVFQDISFSVNAGEVVGLYGLVGAGRTEIVETIFGVRKRTGGTIKIAGQKQDIKTTEDAVRANIGLVPENRKEQGLVLRMSCKDNIVAAKIPQLLNKLKMFDEKKAMEIYDEYQEKLSIASPSPNQWTLNLSGGNQQKIVLGKWLCMTPRVLILDEPTRGIDVGTKSEIYRLIDKLANDGMAIIVISSEMPEILGVCDRVITIVSGRITGEFHDEHLTEENIMHAIAL